MTTDQRYMWTLGAINGAIVVGVIATVYALLSGWEFYAEVFVVAAPFGLVTAWRAAVFIGRLRRGKETPFRGPLEGFLLTFGVALVYLVYNIMRAHLAGAEPQGWGREFWSLFVGYVMFYSLMAGAGGAVTGAALEAVDVLVVSWSSPAKPSKGFAQDPL